MNPLPVLPQSQSVYYLIAALVILAGIVFKLLKRWRGVTLDHIFIRDMANNHLPHIYVALELLGNKLDVDIPNHPRIKFLEEKDFEGE
jgi:hypothetical protein